MELIQQDSGSFVIRLKKAELIALNNSLNESLDGHSRMGIPNSDWNQHSRGEGTACNPS